MLPVSRAHRSLVAEMRPAVVRRTFTLPEFARLLKRVDLAALPIASPGERLRAAIPLAASQRGRIRVSLDKHDVIDPFRRPDDIYRTSFAQIVPAVETIVKVAAPA